MADKKTKGKQKIEMKKIDNENDRMITFSKRKSGIFKKAHELISTCNAEVGLLVFSKAGTPFTFAHPSIETVLNRFMNPTQQPQKDNAELLIEAYKKECVNQLNEEHESLVDALQVEKEREKVLQKMSKEIEIEKFWLRSPIEEANLEELQRMHNAFVELHDVLCDMVIEHSPQLGEGPSSAMGPNPFALIDQDEANTTRFPPRNGLEENEK